MAWGARQLLRTGRILGLSLLIAADVITCWYMAYITLLFCCLLVLFELAVMIYDEDVRPSGKWIAGRAVRFTVAILLGMGLSAWTFVPTVLAMMGGGAKTAVGMFQTYPVALIRGFLPSAWNIAHTPQFYTGLIPLVLAIAMLFEKRIDKRLRALTLVFAGFLVVSTVPGLLMYVWCGFRQPNGFYCRIAFLLSFLEIWAAAFLLMKRAVCRSRVSGSQTVSWTEVGSRPKYANSTIRRLAPLGALLLAILDLGFNAHACWNQLYINYPQDTHDTYVGEVDAQIRELKQLDTDAFYRVDKTYNRAGAAFNKGISHGFNQLSTYSSANNPKAVAFLSALGYSSEGEFSSVYAAPNLVMDSLLGVRYIGTWSKPVESTETTLPHSNVTSPLYHNPHALSLGYPCANDTDNESAPQGDNPFERQNALFAELTGIDRPLYTQLQGVEQARSDASITWAVELPAHAIGYTYAQTGVEPDWSQSVGLIVSGEMISSEATRFSHNVRAFGESGDESTQHEISMVQGSPETHLPPPRANACSMRWTSTYLRGALSGCSRGGLPLTSLKTGVSRGHTMRKSRPISYCLSRMTKAGAQQSTARRSRSPLPLAAECRKSRFPRALTVLRCASSRPALRSDARRALPHWRHVLSWQGCRSEANRPVNACPSA